MSGSPDDGSQRAVVAIIRRVATSGAVAKAIAIVPGCRAAGYRVLLPESSLWIARFLFARGTSDLADPARSTYGSRDTGSGTRRSASTSLRGDAGFPCNRVRSGSLVTISGSAPGTTATRSGCPATGREVDPWRSRSLTGDIQQVARTSSAPADLVAGSMLGSMAIGAGATTLASTSGREAAG
jgi:hypothetical protein